MLDLVKRKSQVLPLDDGSFQKSLYKNSNLSRIVLHKPIRDKINLNTWYRIDLKLVTEMGLMMDQHPFKIKVSCSVLYKNQFMDAAVIQTRPVAEDAWDPEVSQCEGFLSYKGIGAIEFKVNANIKNPFFISLLTEQSNILPLAVGPICIEKRPHHWYQEEINSLERQQYRTLQSSLSSDTYFLLKEHWDYGTPGKIWDSAIVMTDVLLNLFDVHPDQFSNKRILDLSAGTGYIGLSIAQYYQNKKNIQSPEIILTDLEEALDLIQQNRQLNHVDSSHLQIRSLMWGCKQEAQDILQDGALDIIIASDVLYNVMHFPTLISTFVDLCDRNTIIYLCYKQRGLTLQEEQSFFDQCSDFFKITEVQHIHGLPIQNSTAVRIYQLELLEPKPIAWSRSLTKIMSHINLFPFTN